MSALFALLQLKKVLYPTVAVVVLVGATAARAATGGVGLGPVGGTSPAPTATLAGVSTTTPVSASATSSPSPDTAATSNSPRATSTPAGAATTANIPTTDADSENFGAGKNNTVQVINQIDNNLEVRGRIQLNHINGSNASPQNLAYAYSSCRQCQTLAVALQINLIGTSATNVSPQNAAVALNYQCTQCTTIAKAFQYNLSVSNPNETSKDVKGLVHAIKMKLRALNTDKSVTLSDAETQINAVITQYQALTQYLGTKRQQDTSTSNPDATPLPTVAPSATDTATPDGAATATDTGTPDLGATETPTPGSGNIDTPTPTADTGTNPAPSPTATS